VICRFKFDWEHNVHGDIVRGDNKEPTLELNYGKLHLGIFFMRTKK